MQKRRRTEKMQRRLLVAQRRYEECISFILRYHPERDDLKTGRGEG